MSKNQAGKGDKPRPIDKVKFDSNYDQIKWDKQIDLSSKAEKKRGKIVFKY